MVNRLCQASLAAGVWDKELQVHHLEPHVVSTFSKGLPAEVANHLTYTACVVKTVASVSCSPSLNHFQFVYIFRYYEFSKAVVCVRICLKLLPTALVCVSIGRTSSSWVSLYSIVSLKCIWSGVCPTLSCRLYGLRTVGLPRGTPDLTWAELSVGGIGGRLHHAKALPKSRTTIDICVLFFPNVLRCDLDRHSIFSGGGGEKSFWMI